MINRVFVTWLNIAIQELDTKAMTPEQRLAYEMIVSANALAIKNENKKIEEAKAAESLAIKTESVKQMLLSGQLSDADIAEFSLTSIDFVKSVKQKISADK